MTAIMVSPVLYVCDSCQAEADGTTARMPKGWREERFTRIPGRREDDFIGHLCPECIPPEAT